MEHTVIHRAASRGVADHGWLKSYQTFSFSAYYNPERMQFGALRVLNDDTVNGGMGFGKHPHDNMEIISIPLEGALMHRDSMNNEAVIKAGEIQVMSAGTGIYHSEYNSNENEPAQFLQIWLYPNKRNVEPRYDQVQVNVRGEKNRLVQVLSPNPDDEGVWIYQDAWFHMGRFDKGVDTSYTLKQKDNGVYIFVIKGSVSVGNQELNTRDGIGITGQKEMSISALTDAEYLVMEVPMLTNA